MIGDAASGGWETAGMGTTSRFLARLWTAERGIASVEYAMLLAMISGGIVMGVEFLSGAVSDQMSEAAAWFGDDGLGGDGCGNDGSGDGTGGDGGSGQGGDNTC